MTTLKNGKLFFGCTLKRGCAASYIRFPVLPFESLKKFVHSHSDQTYFDSNSLLSNDQQVEFVFREKGSETNLSFAEVQHETTEQEGNLNTEEKEITSFAEAKDLRQANQVEMSTPLISLPLVHTTPLIPEWSVFAVLLGLRVLACIFKLIEKFKNRKKDLYRFCSIYKQLSASCCTIWLHYLRLTQHK